MTGNIQIPADVAEHLKTAARLLSSYARRLDDLHGLWADEDPDPEAGFYWHLHIEHPEATRLRKDLATVAEMLAWLSAFTDVDGGGCT